MSYFTPERRSRKSPLPLVVLGGLCISILYYAYTANQKTEPVLPENAVRPHLVRWLEVNPDAWPAQDPIFNPAAVRRIYRRADYRLLWFDNYNLSDTANDLLKQLTAASSGNPSSMVDYRYHLGYFDRTLRDTPQRLQMAAILDVLLTDAFVSYAQDTQLDQLRPRRRPRPDITPVSLDEGGFQMASVRGAPRQTAPNPGGRQYFRGYTRDQSRNYPAIDRSRHYSQRHYSQRYNTQQHSRPGLASARSYPGTQSMEAHSLTGAGPNDGPYIEGNAPFGGDVAALREQLALYRSLAASGRWQPLPDGPAMTLGARHRNVPLLRNMLSLYGDYRTFGGEANSDRFDQQLHEAVLRFQRRHGLKPDGIVGRQTRERLNLSPSARVRIIEANISRRQQLPANLGSRFLHVNVPEYRLHYVRDHRVRLSMNVVVGKKEYPTPEMNTRLSKVVFNPTWTVPRTILQKEILPKARANPSAMERAGYRVVKGNGELMPLTPGNLSAAGNGRYFLRQMGGEENILGRLKFEIPNSDAIYLHDTRGRSLFSLTDRARSYGCVRLEKPRQLAEAMLRNEGDWDRYRIDRLTLGDETTEVRVQQQVPVYITYWTAWVDGEGQLNFRPDIYGKDGVRW